MNSRPQINSTLESDPDLCDLVEMFVDALPERIKTLSALAAARDWPMLGTTAHQLKGAFGGYGFAALFEPACELESAVREGRSEREILRALEDLLTLCRRVRYGHGPDQVIDVHAQYSNE